MPDLTPLPAGLVAVTGDERTGKTTLLRQLAGDLPPAPGSHHAAADAFWLDLSLPGHDADTPPQLWARIASRRPAWNNALQQDLAEALGLQPHLHKTLSMLSTGSRRKVGIVALLAAGATVTCLDQPYAALDAGSIRVLREFLLEAAEHAERTWVVADHVADPKLAWRRVVSLD